MALSFTQPALDFLSQISFAPFNLGVQITAVALPCLLLSETAHSSLGRWIFKPLASLGFMVAAVSYLPSHIPSSTSPLLTLTTVADIPKAFAESGGLGGLATTYLAELKHIIFNVAPTIATPTTTAAASAVVVHTTYTKAMMGAFVLGAIGDVLLIPKKGFLPGLVSFLAGHAAFMVAFTFHGQDTAARQKGLGFIVSMAAVVGPWLLPKIKNKIMRGAVSFFFVMGLSDYFGTQSFSCGEEIQIDQSINLPSPSPLLHLYRLSRT
jgi:hypothetical protein